MSEDNYTLVKFENGKYGVKRVGLHFTEFLDMTLSGGSYWWCSPAHVGMHAQTRWKWRAEKALRNYKVSLKHTEI